MWRACCGTAELFVWPENFFICLLNAGATHPSYPEQAHPSQTKFTLDQNVKPFCMLEMTVATAGILKYYKLSTPIVPVRSPSPARQ